jgi:hypothetical protein
MAITLSWEGFASLPPYTLASLIGVGLGLLAHVGLFIHGEWHVQAPPIFLFHAFLYGSLSIGSMIYGAGTLWAAGLITSICYLAALLTSIFIYRTCFHQLTRAGFKGPFYMRVSKIFHVWKCRKSLNHLLLNDLQKRYGDFIRTGLNPLNRSV